MITFTQGDVITLNFTAYIDNNTPVDLSGASFVTYVRNLDNDTISFPNSQHTANPDQTNNTGQYALALGTNDTAQIRFGNEQEIITQITLSSGQIIYFHGMKQINVLANTPVFSS